MDHGLKLAQWVLAAVPGATHLKLQKLLFYAYGAALAHDREHEVGPIGFQAWEHGPVCVSVWREYRVYEAQPLPSPSAVGEYSRSTEVHLQDAVDVYRQLGAWSLRNETHLEAPWLSSWTRRARHIDPVLLKQHFYRKFRNDVAWPEHLGRPSSLILDGIPQETFPSLHDLAEAVRAS